jgi:asparagine synthase (glutamine-hydrolysing)
MCGIGAIVRIWRPEQREHALSTPHGASIPEPWLDAIDEGIKHRGPDGQGRFRDRALRPDGCVVDVALVHRRLSIIDHVGGHQPMVLVADGAADPGPGRVLSASERALACSRHEREISHPNAPREPLRIAVTFNGCIYNHRELRAELQGLGYAFATDHSDTEVLLHGWRAWGPALIDRLDGMFACLIWDSGRRSLTSLRDPFGEKPLAEWAMTTELGPIVALASTPAALARLSARGDGRERPIGPRIASGTWLSGWVQHGWCGNGPWDSASDQPGTAREIAGSRSMSGALATEIRSARPAPPGVPAPLPARGHVEHHSRLTVDDVDRLLRRAVQSRLDADVTLGCFLSGGIDSGLIARFAREHRPDITAYTVRMPVESFDESAFAASTARALGVRHRILDCQMNPASDLVALIQQAGLPFGDSSLLPMRWVSAAAKREVSVALSGDGGDELFLGYQRQVAAPWLARLQRLGPDALDSLRAIGSMLGRSARRRDRAMRLLDAACLGGYADLSAIFPAPLSRELGIFAEAESRWTAGGELGLTDPDLAADPYAFELATRRFDRAAYLPFDLLRKADLGSMSAALEVRAPFLEPDVVRASMLAPRDVLMPGGRRKGLLREVARRHLPREIVDRPKMGFAIPIGEWFRTDFGGMRTLLLDHLSSVEPFGPSTLGIHLNAQFIQLLLDEHLGTGLSGVVKRDHSQRLYMLLVLSIWAKWLVGLR